MVFVKQIETEILLILQIDWGKLLDWGENSWKHLEKFYLSLVKMGLHDIGSILEK